MAYVQDLKKGQRIKIPGDKQTWKVLKAVEEPRGRAVIGPVGGGQAIALNGNEQVTVIGGGFAQDSAFKPGDHVVIQAGYGGKGGQAGQDFKRFNSDTPAVVTDIAGGDVYVRPEGSNYKWKVQAKALVEGTTKASGHDADRRSRLHRALDAVMDSCGARARDAREFIVKQTSRGWTVFEDGVPGYPYPTKDKAVKQAEGLASLRVVNGRKAPVRVIE